MELVKDVGGRPQKSLSEQQVQEVKTLAGVLSKQQLAAYFGMCENTLNEICKRQRSSLRLHQVLKKQPPERPYKHFLM